MGEKYREGLDPPLDPLEWGVGGVQGFAIFFQPLPV